jgi:hypothetical protein
MSMTWVDWWRWFMWIKRRTTWIGFVLLVLLVSGCSNIASGNVTPENSAPSEVKINTSTPTSTKPNTLPAQLVIEKWTSLPDKLIGNALAVDNKGGVYSIGGYNGKHSIDKIYRIDDKVTTYAKLPVLMHDEAAGWIGDNLYMIGGGQSNSYDTIYQMTPDKKVKLTGHFPLPLSDGSAVPYTLNGNPGLMIIGGYDGKIYHTKVRMLRPQDQTLHWIEPFGLPVGLRYGAVTTNGHDIFIAGGQTPTVLSDKIYVWSEKEQKIRLLATLPGARQKAAAFVFQNQLWIIGGIDSKGKILDQIVEVNTDTGETKKVQPFPTPIADMGYSQDQNTGYLAGGQLSKKQYASTVYKLTISR